MKTLTLHPTTGPKTKATMEARISFDWAWDLVRKFANKAEGVGPFIGTRILDEIIIGNAEADADADTLADRAFSAWESGADWALHLTVLGALQQLHKAKARPKDGVITLRLRKDYTPIEYGFGAEPGRWHKAAGA